MKQQEEQNALLKADVTRLEDQQQDTDGPRTAKTAEWDKSRSEWVAKRAKLEKEIERLKAA